MPSWLTQLALGWHMCGEVVGTAAVIEHSSTSVQYMPSPQKPGSLQVQLYEPPRRASYAPAVLVQFARVLQSCVPSAHSSMSVQLTPSPS